MSRRFVTGVLVLLVAAGCSTDRKVKTLPTSTTGATSTTTSTTLATTTTTAPVVATASWRPGCPVPLADLRSLAIEYWGFDDQRHVGTLVVHASVASAVTRVFAALYKERFPIRRMEPIDVYGGDDEKSLEADNTAGFNCRRAVASGPPRWSVHAYGKAIDVNPQENPYLEGGKVHPANGAEYVQRSPYRPGMAVAGGVLVRAFAAVGWQWGGRWSGTPDYQHFSATGG
jgi:hypothetical protein